MCAFACTPCPARTSADALLRQGVALSKVRLIRVLVPSAALITTCAVVAAALTSPTRPLTISAATPRPSATASVTIPQATPRPKPKAAVAHHTTTTHYNYVPVSYQQPV